ncbi:motility associated factor glycosyltransferase family protein, partial [bacterium]|nr:motility associated factor glycosyltransferase family protein [bacterium]
PDMPESFVQYGAKRFLNNLNSTIRTVKDVSGNLVPTKADYLTFIRIFEKAAENIKNVELINSSMGADIKGFKNIKLEDALFGLPPVEKLELGKYKSHYNLEKFKKEVDILYNNLDKVHILIDDFIAISQKLLKEAQIKKTITPNVEKLIEKYKNSFDTLLNEFSNEDVSNLLSSIAYNVRDILAFNYYSDYKTLSDALEKIIPVFIKMKKYTRSYIISLADCKALIL